MKKETLVNDLKNIKFEEALKKLEKIVEKLEGGQVDLEESLTLYEEGISLFRHCSKKLDEAKKKVEILTKTSGNELEPKPFKMEKGDSSSDEEIPF